MILVTKNEMYLCINGNARPNNNQLKTYYQRVHYLLIIQQYPVNKTFNTLGLPKERRFQVVSRIK